VAAFSGFQAQFDLFGLAVGTNAEGITRFDGIEDADEALSHLITDSDLSGHLLLANLAGGNEDKRPISLFRQGFGCRFHRVSGSLHQLPKVLQENVGRAQIRLHHLRTVQLTECSSKAKAIKSGKNADD